MFEFFAVAAAFSLPGTEVVDMPTAANGVEYQIYVHVPDQCRVTNMRCPAVYTLDAEYAFPLAATIVPHLADRGRLQPVVTVSIGYRDKSLYRPNRTRDYTPVAVDAQGTDPNLRGSGGASMFRAVLGNEIIPFVESRWPVAPGDRTLVGHSYGGLFAADTLLREPGLFANYLIVSPSLWYADEEIFSRLAPMSGHAPDRQVRVYVAVGEREEQPANGRPMVSQGRRFITAMEQWGTPAVSTHFETIAGETHASVFPVALSNGLRILFGPSE